MAEQNRSVRNSRADLPEWARRLRQPRDPKSGLLKPRRCGHWGRGHQPHHIPAIRSDGVPHTCGHLVAVDDNLITVDFDDGDVRRFRNHEPERLLEIVGGLGGVVRSPEGYFWLLRSASGHLFSLIPENEGWDSCDPGFATSTASKTRLSK